MRTCLITFLLLPLLTLGQTGAIDSLLRAHILPGAENPVHSILFYIEKEGQSILYDKGFDSSGQPVATLKNSRFKIASSTKLFVSTLILQLLEEGKLGLNDKASQYLKNRDGIDFGNFHLYRGKNYSDKMTLHQLLSHRTGLADIFSDKQDEFFTLLMENPQKQYSPETIVDLYFQMQLNEAPHFEPGQGWFYSDMNYVLLGLIIETIEGQPLAQSIRNRILVPLKMENTYFEFYEPPVNNGNIQHQWVGNFDFSTLNTSFDWAGGGLVSTNKDLSVFIKALFEHRLISKNSLQKMLDFKPAKKGENRYGLGIYETDYNGKIFYGHYGFYGTYIGYCPEDKTVLSYSIGQAMPGFFVYDFVSQVLEQAE